VIWLFDKFNNGINLDKEFVAMKNGIKHEFEDAGLVSDPDGPLKTASGELPVAEASKRPQDLLARCLPWLKRYEEHTTKWMAFNKAQIFPLLKAAGIALVTVGYSGCGDSGQIDDMFATGPKAESGAAPVIALPDAKVTLRVPSFNDSNAPERTLSLREAIEGLCWTLLETEHAGWVNNDGGEGTFTFDVGTEHIELQHTRYYTESNSYDYEL
jgi:uncharacterized protein DUF6878